jgi:hypothetical protein
VASTQDKSNLLSRLDQPLASESSKQTLEDSIEGPPYPAFNAEQNQDVIQHSVQAAKEPANAQAVSSEE